MQHIPVSDETRTDVRLLARAWDVSEEDVIRYLVTIFRDGDVPPPEPAEP
ncbi:hypothetical protein GCM10009754_36400 [Amycolatopsis minnesotensis]|uniref:CopG family transcriptional regulator n=1 Tax=Amycolatopsis minnesotensis TaxID=337894 RepID=A0ABN2R1H0_9PSEU